MIIRFGDLVIFHGIMFYRSLSSSRGTKRSKNITDIQEL